MVKIKKIVEKAASHRKIREYHLHDMHRTHSCWPSDIPHGMRAHVPQQMYFEMVQYAK